MKIISALFAAPLLLTTITNAGADTATIVEPTAADAAAPVARTSHQSAMLLEQLRLHIQELKGVLSQQPQDMTLIKTKTSWIRKQLTDLHDWSVKQNMETDAKPSLEKFRIIIDNMLQEVERDDMLDLIDLQSLSVNYTQAELIISDIQRKQEQAGKPVK